MDLTPYVGNLRHELVAAAENGTEEVRVIAERLIATLESATRLTLLDALAAAADEISRDLAPGSVDLRLRGRDPHFVVTTAQGNDDTDDGYPAAPAAHEQVPVPVNGKDGAIARINFRPPEHLKLRIDDAAAREGLSVNAWLVRVTTAAAENDNSTPRSSTRRGQNHTGWVG
jgi:hypothetical protein